MLKYFQKASLYFFLFIVASCNTIKYQKAVINYKEIRDKQNPMFLTSGKIIMKVLKPVKVFETRWEGVTLDYYYSDSSLIYLSNAFYASTPNDSLIRYDKGCSLKGLWPDTISFSGIDAKGRYWKEIKYMNVYYGYTKVPADKIELVEGVMKAVKIK